MLNVYSIYLRVNSSSRKSTILVTIARILGGRKSILEPKASSEGMRELHTNGYTHDLEFINSYQSIKIFEDGTIHIIH